MIESFLSGVLLAIVLPVAEVQERFYSFNSSFPARVVTIAQVDVIPQVSGEILEVCFKNGQMVKAGDVLYRLDSVKYEAAVKNTEAKVVEMRANAAYAEDSYERHKRLLETRAVSLDAVDNALSQRDSWRASYAAAQADLVAARDDLKHCTIVAPISGKIGTTLKTKGNYVTSGSQKLVTIVQSDPIHVRFSVSNREFLDITSSVQDFNLRDINLSLRLANGSQYTTPGFVEYVDNFADEATDTVMLYAHFDNPDGKLVPGGTVGISCSTKQGVKKVAIPPTAILQDTQGPYVWVLDEKNVASRRTIARGDLKDDWLFIEKGLKAGERIVADGAHRVKRGDIVEAVK
jgi:membrane fusion protein (multidrug efflux system)